MKSKKSVVIVESPAKAKTINKILGSGYEVVACMGHIRDLPQRALGIDIENNFEPTYKTVAGKGKIMKELRVATKEAGAIYLAPDPDREGEAIAWHLTQALKMPEGKTHRVTFNEITRDGVLNAFKNPTVISMDRVNAQQARRLLDRLVGYKLSPLLWKKIGKGLSAGRVQSVAVKLIVEREKEIEAFKPEEYWEIAAHLLKLSGGEEFKAFLSKIDGKDAEVKNGDQAKSLVDSIRKEKFVVAKVTQKEKFETPPSPFTTSLLQQQASIKLRFSTKKTMMLAQQLYEGVELGEEGPVGLITYMRTDSTRIAEEAITAVRKFIKEKYGQKYLVDTPRRYKAKKGAQEAHEAIRPTYAEKTPDSISGFLTDDQYKLYKLIWRRFVATQMKAALYLATDAEIKAGAATFVAKGKEQKFDGYTLVTGATHSKDEQLLPSLSEGEELNLKELVPSQHFTQPPPRYSEAILVKTLEKYGIGRPSTYAPIISNIQDKGYVLQEERKLKPTELGKLVTEKLVSFFNDIMDVAFTARMEEELDMVEDAKKNWVDVLKEFYAVFSGDLDKAKGEMETEKNKTLEGEENQKCEKCGKPMVVRWNRFGKFLGCSGFPDCKSTKSLVTPETVNEKCEKCGSPMVLRRNKRGQRFLACSAYPNCKNTRSLQSGGKKYNIPTDFDIPCEQCGTKMVVKYSRRGGFLACPRYPDCKSTKSFPKEWFAKKDSEESPAEVAE